VDGTKEQLGDKIELIFLNLLSPVGREAARAFGVYIVPATLLIDGNGKIVLRKLGMPKAAELVDGIMDLCSLVQQ
jgi:hypothetical protein